MEKSHIRLIWGIVVGVIIAFYVGAMINFFPFIGNDLIVNEIGFCTLIICAVIAICTGVIISEIKKKQ